MRVCVISCSGSHPDEGAGRGGEGRGARKKGGRRFSLFFSLALPRRTLFAALFLSPARPQRRARPARTKPKKQNRALARHLHMHARARATHTLHPIKKEHTQKKGEKKMTSPLSPPLFLSPPVIPVGRRRGGRLGTRHGRPPPPLGVGDDDGEVLLWRRGGRGTEKGGRLKKKGRRPARARSWAPQSPFRGSAPRPPSLHAPTRPSAGDARGALGTPDGAARRARAAAAAAAAPSPPGFSVFWGGGCAPSLLRVHAPSPEPALSRPSIPSTPSPNAPQSRGAAGRS